MIRAILLDFDGVILESVSVKTEAFRELFSIFPEYVDEIVQFHLDNGGMSRFEKFHYIYTHILQKDLPEKEFESLSRQFSVLVEDAVNRAPFVEGAPEFLETMHKKCRLYIVSATPQEELVRIVKNRGIFHYFTGVFGAPAKKTDHIRAIMTQANICSGDMIFIGDAVND
jgi:phosphoglycolate phosphatase-like HAD superfamily hydrolase